MAWSSGGGGGGGGGGGSSAPLGTDQEVSDGTQASLVTALAAATDGTYISADITITSTVTLSKNVVFKPGITVTITAAVGTGGAFTASTQTRLYNDAVVNIDAQHTGDVFRTTGSGYYIQKGVLSFDLSAGSVPMSINSDCFGEFDTFIGASLNNAFAQWASGLTGNGCYIRSILLTGAGSSCRIRLRNMRVGTVQIEGTWQAYTTQIDSQYAIQIDDGHAEIVKFATSSNGYGLSVSDGRVGVFETKPSASHYLGLDVGGSLGGISIPNTVTIVGNGTSTRPAYYGSGSYSEFANEPGTTKNFYIGSSFNATTAGIQNVSRSAFIGCYQDGTETLQGACDDNDFIGTQFNGAVTFASGAAENRFTNVYFAANQTFPSGCEASLDNCRFGGTVTFDSGANCSVSNCTFASSFTNNDGFNTRIIGCKNTSGERWMNNDGFIEFKATSTTDATKTELFVDSSSLQIDLSSDQGMRLKVSVLAQRDNQDQAFWELDLLILNDGGTTTLSGGGDNFAPDSNTGTGSGADVRLHANADDTNDSLKLEFTGVASQNWTVFSKAEIIQGVA